MLLKMSLAVFMTLRMISMIVMILMSHQPHFSSPATGINNIIHNVIMNHSFFPVHAASWSQVSRGRK